jgi:hypothetical protein
LPPLSLLYLLAIRTGRLEPAIAPVIALALLPLASAVIGALALRAPSRARGRHVGVLLLAVVELAWAALAAAMVGFAIAWRSG